MKNQTTSPTGWLVRKASPSKEKYLIGHQEVHIEDVIGHKARKRFTQSMWLVIESFSPPIRDWRFPVLTELFLKTKKNYIIAKVGCWTSAGLSQIRPKLASKFLIFFGNRKPYTNKSINIITGNQSGKDIRSTHESPTGWCQFGGRWSSQWFFGWLSS